MRRSSCRISLELSLGFLIQNCVKRGRNPQYTNPTMSHRLCAYAFLANVDSVYDRRVECQLSCFSSRCSEISDFYGPFAATRTVSEVARVSLGTLRRWTFAHPLVGLSYFTRGRIVICSIKREERIAKSTGHSDTYLYYKFFIVGSI